MFDTDNYLKLLQVLVGVGFVVYALFKLKELLTLALFGVTAFLHVIAFVGRFLHKQLWHRRINRYVPGFSPPLRPKTAAILGGLLLITGGIAGWDLWAPDHPNQADWISALAQTKVKPVRIPEGLKILSTERAATPIPNAEAVVMNVQAAEQNGALHYYVFPEEPEAVTFFVQLKAAATDDPEWRTRHTVDYNIGDTEVLCIDRVDQGVGCFITVADGTVIEARADRMGQKRETAVAGAQNLLELGLWHWTDVADEVGWL